jgi:hypothetical protein
MAIQGGDPVLIPATSSGYFLKDDGTWANVPGSQKVAFGAESDLTISSGAVTVTQTYHSIVVEGGVGSGADTLSSAAGGSEGDMLIIKPNTSGANDQVTVADGTGAGAFILNDGLDFIMNHVDDRLMLIHNGTEWVEQGRISGSGTSQVGDPAIWTSDGLKFTPASDEDVKLLTAGVTGTPAIFWDESDDDFNFNKGLDITGNIVISGTVDGVDVAAHKDRHDPNDGADPLDTAAPSELAGVQASGVGTSHSLARADHQHQIQHAVTDNHIVTVDDASIGTGEVAIWTANGIEGSDIGMGCIATNDATTAEKAWAIATGGTVGNDDSDETDINAFVVAGKTLQILGKNAYIDGTITAAVANFTMDLGGSVINLENSSDVDMITVGGNNWTIRNGTLDGNSGNQTALLIGITGNGKDYGVIDNVRVTDVSAAQNGGGVKLFDAENWIVSRVDSSSNPYGAGIWFSKDSTGCDSNIIIGCFTQSNAASTNNPGILLDNSDNTVVVGCISSGNSYNNFQAGESNGGSYIAFVGCISYGCTEAEGFRLKDTTNVVIVGCVSHGEVDGENISMADSDYVAIVGCAIGTATSAGSGINIWTGYGTSEYVTITGNSIENWDAYAITIDDAAYININANVMHSDWAGWETGGVCIVNSTRTLIQNNILSLNADEGVHFSATGDDSLIQNNFIIVTNDTPTPQGAGIELDDGDDVFITGNRIIAATAIDINDADVVGCVIMGNIWEGSTADPSYASATDPRWHANIDKDGEWYLVDDYEVLRKTWVKHDAQNPSVCTVPAGSFVTAEVWVKEAFDSDGTDTITVGYDADPDSIVTSIDVSSTGRKTVTYGVEGGYMATSRAIEIYYTNGGSEPNNGEALVVLKVTTCPAP